MVRDGWADGWTDGKSDRWVSHLKKIRDTRGFSLMPLGKKESKTEKGRVSLLKINSGKMIKQKTFS